MGRYCFVSLAFAGVIVASGFGGRLFANEEVFIQPLYALQNGDTNGDWEMDLSDAVYLLQHLYNGGPAPVPAACGLESAAIQNGDANGDGELDLSDPVFLLSYLYTGGAAPVSCTGAEGLGVGGDRNPNPRVIPIHARPYGHSYTEWSEKFWQRAVSIPADRNPALGRGSCDVNQSGPVWFLLGPLGEMVNLSCTVPAGKAIFFPPVATENDFPCPDPSFAPAPGQSLEDFLTAGARAIIDGVTSVGVEVDGVALRNLSNQRVTSPLFTFTGDPSLTAEFDSCLTGSPQSVVSDGYWIMLAPLPVGEHLIHVTVVFGTTVLQVFNHLTVVPRHEE